MSALLRRLVGRLGPQVRCTQCGRPLFRGFAVVHRGQVKLMGADTALIRVDFDTTERLGFRHVEQSVCRGSGTAGPPA